MPEGYEQSQNTSSSTTRRTAKRRGEELTDEQWVRIVPLLSELPRRQDCPGRPWRENREVLNEVVVFYRTGRVKEKLLPCRRHEDALPNESRLALDIMSLSE
jgi:hypothetical protein